MIMVVFLWGKNVIGSFSGLMIMLTIKSITIPSIE